MIGVVLLVANNHFVLSASNSGDGKRVWFTLSNTGPKQVVAYVPDSRSIEFKIISKSVRKKMNGHMIIDVAERSDPAQFRTVASGGKFTGEVWLPLAFLFRDAGDYLVKCSYSDGQINLNSKEFHDKKFSEVGVTNSVTMHVIKGNSDLDVKAFVVK